MTFLAQLPEDTASDAPLIFGMVALVGILSLLAVTTRGRRSLMPLVAVGMGVLIGYQSISDAVRSDQISVLTVMGLLIAGVLGLGGLGALREGIAIPPVEGQEPAVPSGTARGASKDAAAAGDPD